MILNKYSEMKGVAIGTKLAVSFYCIMYFFICYFVFANPKYFIITNSSKSLLMTSIFLLILLNMNIKKFSKCVDYTLVILLLDALLLFI